MDLRELFQLDYVDSALANFRLPDGCLAFPDEPSGLGLSEPSFLARKTETTEEARVVGWSGVPYVGRVREQAAILQNGAARATSTRSSRMGILRWEAGLG